MPPIPEKANPPQQPQSSTEDAARNRSTRGLGLEVWVKSPTWEVGVGAVLQDFTPGEVILLLDDPIQAKTEVSVQANTCAFHGDILFCRPSGTRWEAHVSVDDVDASGLRRTPRFPVRIAARVFASATEEPIAGTIVDISGEGLGIEMASAVAVGANIAVQSEETVALGKVRHCREIAPGGFRVGVELLHIIRQDRDLAKAAESGWMSRLGLGRKKTR
jgi:hypothetical protein